MFPPPKIVQDDEENSPKGADTNIHDTSPVNPDQPTGESGPAEAKTVVPAAPDSGINVKMPTGPDVTVNVVLAESLAPKLD